MKYNKKANSVGDIMRPKDKMKKSLVGKAIESMKKKAIEKLEK